MAAPSDSILSAFQGLAERTPAAPLFVSSGPRRVSVGGIDALARAARQVLAAEPTQDVRDRTVGLVAPNGPGFLAAFLALRRSGARVLLLDPQSPGSDLRRTAAALGASALFICRDGWPQGAQSFAWEGLAAQPALPYPEGTSVVKLTSGSTGHPRGVAVSSEALVADDAALATTMGLRDGERILATIPMSHSYGFSSVVLPALLRGSLLVVPDPRRPLSPLAAAERAEATFFPTVPAYLQALLKMSKPPRWPASLGLVISAGAQLPPETAARFRETYGLPVHAFYGASECGGICYDREGDAGVRGTVGAPVDGVRVTLDPLGGVEGGVVVSSPAVGLGYYPVPEARLGGGRFTTSDVGCWTGGELKLLRRLDSLINVKGKKVDPSEIERVVLALPGVEDVVALGVPADLGTHLLRVVIACGAPPIRYEEVLAHCRTHLPDHKVPRSILLVSKIPRTSRGKVDRGALLAADAETRLDG